MEKLKGSSEKVTWKQVREQVQIVNPEFAAIIDEMSPGDDHWMVRAKYPYGSQVLDKSLFLLPNVNGDIVPITDESIDKEIRAGLSYNLESNPVSLVLKNSFEIYYPLADRTLPFTGVIPQGTVFGAWRILHPQTTEHPAFLWDMSSGARSVFMLPKISEAIKHKKMEKLLGININIPKALMQHWDVFKKIANSNKVKPWNAEIIYFSEPWFKHLNDPAWAKFYNYFEPSQFWRNKPFWDMVFSLIIEEYEAKPNAHIMDTVKYLLYMGVGSLPGFSAVKDTIAGPFDIIQDVYSNIYGLRNYPPIILQPKYFGLRNSESQPVYYSSQVPSTVEFKPSTRLRTSIVSDLHEIRSLMLRCEKEFLEDKYNLKGTSFYDLFNIVQFDYFHKTSELHNGMCESSKMSEDIALRTTVNGKVYNEFPSASLFAKGCIRVSRKISH